jgi:hypothetical protein
MTNKFNFWIRVLGVAAALVCVYCLGLLGLVGWIAPRIPDDYEVHETIQAKTPRPALSQSQPTSTPTLESGQFLPGDEVPTAPEGGLAGDLLRSEVWTEAQVLAAAADCPAPSAARTVISVEAEPANGQWQEVWAVACSSGKTIPVLVVYSKSADGGVYIDVSMAK